MKNKDKFKKVTKESNQSKNGQTKLDEFEDQKFVDDIPVEKLNIEAEQEKDKRKTQNTSQNERKYDGKK